MFSAFLRKLDTRELPQQGQVVGRLKRACEDEQPAELRSVSSQPESSGATTAERLRGTAVTLAASMTP